MERRQHIAADSPSHQSHRAAYVAGGMVVAGAAVTAGGLYASRRRRIGEPNLDLLETPKLDDERLESLNRVAALVIDLRPTRQQVVDETELRRHDVDRLVGHLQDAHLIVTVPRAKKPDVVPAHYEPLPPLVMASEQPEVYPRLGKALQVLRSADMEVPRYDGFPPCNIP